MLTVAAALLISVVLALQAWRLADQMGADRAWAQLQTPSLQPTATFKPEIVEELP